MCWFCLLKLVFSAMIIVRKWEWGVRKRRVATQSEIIIRQLAVGGGVPSCYSLCRQLQFARDSCNVTTSLGSLGLMGLINF